MSTTKIKLIFFWSCVTVFGSRIECMNLNLTTVTFKLLILIIEILFLSFHPFAHPTFVILEILNLFVKPIYKSRYITYINSNLTIEDLLSILQVYSCVRKYLMVHLH